MAFFFKNQQNKRAEGENAPPPGEGGFSDEHKNITMKHRLQKDMASLDLPPGTSLTYNKLPNGEPNLQNFHIFINPTDESYWNGGKYDFEFFVPENYPYDPPKVKCLVKIYHPNIDLDGNVCLNILRKDWKPVLNINHVIFGLETLFLAPNPEDPLNKDAAIDMTQNLKQFIENVRSSLKGTFKTQGHTFPKLI